MATAGPARAKRAPLGRFGRRSLGRLTQRAGALLAVLALSILTAVVEPHVHAGRPGAHHAAASDWTEHGHAQAQSPEDALQPLCALCAAQDAGRAVFAPTPSRTAPAPRTVAVAPAVADRPDGLHDGRSWRSRAPPRPV